MHLVKTTICIILCATIALVSAQQTLLDVIWTLDTKPAGYVTFIAEVATTEFLTDATSLSFSLLPASDGAAVDCGFYEHDPKYEAGGKAPPLTETRAPQLTIDDKKYDCDPIGVAAPYADKITCSGLFIRARTDRYKIGFSRSIAILNKKGGVCAAKIGLVISPWTFHPAKSPQILAPTRTTDYPESDFADVIIPKDDFITLHNNKTKQVSFSASINSKSKVVDAVGLTVALSLTSPLFTFLVHNPNYPKVVTEHKPKVTINGKTYLGTIDADKTSLTFADAVIPHGEEAVKVTFDNVFVLRTQSTNFLPVIAVSIPEWDLKSVLRSLSEVPSQETDWAEGGDGGGDDKKPKSNLLKIVLIIVLALVGVAVLVALVKFVVLPRVQKNSANGQQDALINGGDYQSFN